MKFLLLFTSLLLLSSCGTMSSSEFTWFGSWTHQDSTFSSNPSSEFSFYDGGNDMIESSFNDSVRYEAEPFWSTGIAFTWDLGIAGKPVMTQPLTAPISERVTRDLHRFRVNYEMASDQIGSLQRDIANLRAHVGSLSEEKDPAPIIKKQKPWYKDPVAIAAWAGLLSALGVGSWFGGKKIHKEVKAYRSKRKK